MIKSKRNRKLLGTFILLIIIAIMMGICTRKYLQKQYTNAIQAIENGRYSEAKELLEIIGDNYYQNTEDYRIIVEQGIIYEEAIENFNSSNYKEAINKFKSIENFKDSRQWLLDSKYNYSIQLYNNKQYQDALSILINLDYRDSKDYAKELIPIVYNQLIKEING